MSPLRTARPVGLWVGLVLGAPVMGYGIAGAIADSAQVRPVELARWMVGAALVHDLVFAPLVLVAGWLLCRLPGRRVPSWLAWALCTSVVLAVFAWPFVRGYGRSPTMPSALPRNYALGLVAYLGAVWAVAITVRLVERAARRAR